MARLGAHFRLVLRAAILAEIAARRILEGDPGIGASIERQIIDRELAQLEEVEPEAQYGLEP
jgi:hypothetical protein